MNASVDDDPAGSRYVLDVDGEHVGEALYRRHGDALNVYHVEVDPARSGRGLGSELARGLLDDIRTRGLTVVPSCPFLAAFIGKHPGDYLDVVDPSVRDEMNRGTR